MNRMEQKTAGVPTLKRLPLYLRLLRKMKEQGEEYASGAVVARELGLDPVVVRKDLAITGAVGRPRLGFPMDEIILAIEDFLGWSNTSDAFLVGVGNLGRALLGYQGFEPNTRIAGVILNKVGGPRHEHKLRQVVERYTDLKIVGAVQRAPALEIVERHLGLMPSNESTISAQQIENIRSAIADQLDFELLLSIAGSAPEIIEPSPSPAPGKVGAGLRIGVW